MPKSTSSSSTASYTLLGAETPAGPWPWVLAHEVLHGPAHVVQTHGVDSRDRTWPAISLRSERTWTRRFVSVQDLAYPFVEDIALGVRMKGVWSDR